jgi:uncharacterized protein YndB with AHSA1/START domain
MHYSKETVVKAPPDKVFFYISDIQKHPEWAQHKLEVTAVSQGPIAVGSAYQTVGHQMGVSHDRVTVTEMVPNQKFVYESAGKAGLIRHAFELQPADGGTRVVKSMDGVKLALMTRLMAPMVGMLAPKALGSDLAKIKAKLE